MVQDSFAVPKREVDYEVEDQYWGIKIFFFFVLLYLVVPVLPNIKIELQII